MRKTTSSKLAEEGIKSTKKGIIVNAVLAGVKALTGVLGNSYVLLADAAESLADILSSVVVYSGLKVAATPPDENHPYGHGKAEPIAAAVVSMALFFIGAGIAVQSIREIMTPHHAPSPYTLIVLFFVIASKEFMFHYVMRTAKKTNSTVVKTDAWHHRTDALTSMAAFIGISIATFGGKNYVSADAWAALFISGFILFQSFELLKPAINEIMDAAPDKSMRENVKAVARQVDGVLGLDVCLVRKMGFDYFVDIHVRVDGNITVANGHKIAHRVKEAIFSADTCVSDVLVHIEPA